MPKQELSAKDFRDDLLRVLADKTNLKPNRAVHHKDIYDDVALLKGVQRNQFGIAEGTTILWVDRWIQWAFKSLVDEGLGKRSGKGQWALTPQGVSVAETLIAGSAVQATSSEDDPPKSDSKVKASPVTPDANVISLAVGPGQAMSTYHMDPYIRAIAAQETACFSAYSDKSPTCTRCLLAGACMNAMAAELSSIARVLEQEDKKEEARKKMGIPSPKEEVDLLNDAIPASAVPPSTGSKHKKEATAQASLITIMQQSICKHCGKKIPRGVDGYWVRSANSNEGGLYHKECLDVEG